MTLTEIIAIIAAAALIPYCAWLIYLYIKESKARIKAERANGHLSRKLDEIEKILGLPAEEVVAAIREYKEGKGENNA